MSVAAWPLLDRLLWQAREMAFPRGEFVGQESLVSATEISWLAESAGVGEGVAVLDLCCGVAGPGIFVARAFGCDYLGVDANAGSIALARRRASDEGVPARFDVATVPPLPTGTFDVVMVLETLLAFRDKRTLVEDIACALPRGGRLAFTAELGSPLGSAERAAMPGGDTVWLTSLSELRDTLHSCGFRILGLRECSTSHREVVAALIHAYDGAAPDLRSAGGGRVVDDLLASHRLWLTWLSTGRVGKLAVVAEKVLAPGRGGTARA